MRKRLEISHVNVPRNVKPGDTLDVSLTLTVWSKTPVNAITMSFTGRECFVQEEHSPTLKRDLVRLEAELMGEAELATGPRELHARFNLPDDLPISYAGKEIMVEYAVHLHIDIPWWPDLRRSYDITVEQRARPRSPPSPVTHTVEQVGSSMFVEITLDDTTFAPGNVVSGAFAFGNLHGREVQAIELSIVAVEQVTDDYQTDARRFGVSLDTGAVSEGVSQAFRFVLEPGLPPSGGSLSYVFELKAKVRRGRDLTYRIPIQIARLSGPWTGRDERQNQVEVGAERWRKIWAKAGAPLGLSVAGSDVRLTGRVDGADVDVFVDLVTGGASLTADLRFGPLGAGFRVAPRSLMSPQRMLQFLAAEEHGEAFASRYKAEGREEAQVHALLSSPFMQALLAFDEVRMTDDHARAVMRNVGYDQRFIEPFLARVEALARAVSEISEIIPPPSAMTSMKPAWAAFAEELAGKLIPGSMAIHGGQLDGARFDIATLFEDDPDPRGTRVVHLVDPPLSPEVEKTPIESLLAAAPPGTRAIYDEVAKGALEVRVLPFAIEAMLAAPLADPAAERGRMLAMVALARRLRGEKGIGPYR